MEAPKQHKRETERLKDLAKYRIIDSEEEKEYDQIANLAAQICGTKVSLISLVDRDRQWMKSCFGLNIRETSRENSFCGHAINHDDEIFIVKDARKDNRFHDNPFVTGDPEIVFYAGVPLLSDNGNPIGTLCVIDDQPKELTPEQKNALKTLAKNVMSLMELRQHKVAIEKVNAQLEKKNEEMEQFADRAAHDIKAPLRSIMNMLELISKKKSTDQNRFDKIIKLAIDSADNLGNLVDGLLDFARIDEFTSNDKEEVSIHDIIYHLNSTAPTKDYELEEKTSLQVIEVSKSGVFFILRNLLSNAIKYGDKEITKIELSITEEANRYLFSVKDNGPGIKKDLQKRVFLPFETVHQHDKFGERGTGLGLSNIKKVIEKMGGEIWLESSVGEGATFYFSLPK